MLTAMNSTPGNPRLDHAVDGIDAGAPDADHPDHRLVRLTAAGRGVLGLLAPVTRVFEDRLDLAPLLRLLGEDSLEPFRRCLDMFRRRARLRLGRSARARALLRRSQIAIVVGLALAFATNRHVLRFASGAGGVSSALR